MNSEKTVLGIIILFTIGIFGFIIFNIVKNQPVNIASLSPEQIIGTDAHKLGAQNPKVTVVEFSDFECPSCNAFEPHLKEVIAKHGENVQLVYRHFPLPGHKNSFSAAKASEAASLQNKFWEYHDELFGNFADYSDDNYVKFAQKVGLDVEKFKADIASNQVTDAVNDDLKTATDLNLSGTPTFFVIADGKVEPILIQDFGDILKTVESKLDATN